MSIKSQTIEGLEKIFALSPSANSSFAAALQPFFIYKIMKKYRVTFKKIGYFLKSFTIETYTETSAYILATELFEEWREENNIDPTGLMIDIIIKEIK